MQIAFICFAQNQELNLIRKIRFMGVWKTKMTKGNLFPFEPTLSGNFLVCLNFYQFRKLSVTGWVIVNTPYTKLLVTFCVKRKSRTFSCNWNYNCVLDFCLSNKFEERGMSKLKQIRWKDVQDSWKSFGINTDVLVNYF